MERNRLHLLSHDFDQGRSLLNQPNNEDLSDGRSVTWLLHDWGCSNESALIELEDAGIPVWVDVLNERGYA